LPKPIRDVIRPGLRILFCGVNPGLESARVGYHFARPGNRFWKALHQAGFTTRQLLPAEQAILQGIGLGLTNLVSRPTANARGVSRRELTRGAGRIRRKVARYRPAILAILGISAFRSAFDEPMAQVGLQVLRMGETQVWLLPNPSGINAFYQLADLVRELKHLRTYAIGIRRLS
jgi:TDG/mug DNA glycosylase family protein